MKQETRDKIAASRKATREKRLTQTARSWEVKLTGLNKSKTEKLEQVFLQAKWLRNHIIASKNISDYKITNTITSLDKNHNPVPRDLTHLGAHLKQAVLTSVKDDLRGLSASKAKGRKVGALKFSREVNSVNLKELGNSYSIDLVKSRVRLQKLGWFRARGLNQLENGELANAKLVRKPSGYYLKVVAYYPTGSRSVPFTLGTMIGLDMGVKTHVTLSDGREFNQEFKESERLKVLQRKLERQVKGSKSRERTISAIRKEYEKLDNKKRDYANKLVRELLKYERVFMQDEQLPSWSRKKGYVKGGRKLQHSALGLVKAKLVAHERVTVLGKWEPTSKLCVCGVRHKDLHVRDRMFTCPSCGFVTLRDVHAAQNMIRIGLTSPKYKSVAPRGPREVLVEGVSDDQSGFSALFLVDSRVKPEASKSSA